MSGYSTLAHTTLRVREQAGVLFVQMHRPEANNAIDAQLVAELSALLQLVEADQTIRVFVLEGLPHVFCSGLDFNAFDSVPQGAVFDLFKQLATSSKIVVSQVRGKVTAGGIGLVAASDFVFAETGATFALSELLFGLLPAMVLPFLIPRIGSHKARQLALSTQAISSAEAHRWGLVDVCADDISKPLRAHLRRWRRLSPNTVRQLKEYIGRLQPLDPETETLAVTTITNLLADEQISEGIRRYVAEGIAPWSRT